MASFVKIADFVEHLAEGAHDLDTHQLTVALSNTAPGAESSDPTGDGNGLLANVTEISYTNLSSRDLTLTSSSQSSGTYSLVLQDLVLSASGAVATFEFIYIYNDGTAVLTDPLIGNYDYGSPALTLANGESLTIDFTGPALFTLA